VCFLPVLQKLQASPARPRLFVWSTPAARPVLDFSADVAIMDMPLARFNGAWKDPGLLWRILREIRSARPAACLLDSDQGNVAHLAALLSGATIRVGANQPGVRLNRFLTARVAHQRGSSFPQWCWDIGRTFARIALGETWEETPPPPDLAHLLKGAKAPAPSKSILIHPGASREYQRWPLGRFIDLAGRLASDYDVTLIRPTELPFSEAPRGVTLFEPESIASLARIINSSALFIGNNSGPMHIAAALGIPRVILSGPSHPMWDQKWWAERSRILRRDELPCISCDRNHHDSRCHNAAEPLACMQRWSVDAVAKIARDWHSQWTPASLDAK
jgi:ADP-heptose:LPS heptosyltransferase